MAVFLGVALTGELCQAFALSMAEIPGSKQLGQDASVFFLVWPGQGMARKEIAG
jgi:hypothetical protein